MSNKKYTIIDIFPPSFAVINGQKYLMPGWTPVENNVTFSDVKHINPYKKTIKTFEIKGSSGNMYTITKRGNEISCNCPGFKFRGKCKHINQVNSRLT